jgi:hypothetical protein
VDTVLPATGADMAEAAAAAATAEMVVVDVPPLLAPRDDVMLTVIFRQPTDSSMWLLISRNVPHVNPQLALLQMKL